jgi:hypothetical protein
LSMRAYLPNQRANAGHDQNNIGLQIIPRKVRPSGHPAEDRPQVLIIAPARSLIRPGMPYPVQRL